ncbi:recombinase-like helix-turn-helix domain-containing protein [Granulicoccus phenolivorans]|uniref:recombinase-like helix-turn-helix domain-containing protein n=1 Tax=Granulicoccus phenolivorans TaxID=266854 RepID=UPI000425A525|nr:recombinase-like helix-turn-helix domain-containing protein [Granulicoccus phenolivorans]
MIHQQYLDAHQTHPEPFSAYELKLSGSIMEVFGRGTHDLPGLIKGLNDLGLNAPDGTPWTEETFRDEMRRLGN